MHAQNCSPNDTLTAAAAQERHLTCLRPRFGPSPWWPPLDYKTPHLPPFSANPGSQSCQGKPPARIGENKRRGTNTTSLPTAALDDGGLNSLSERWSRVFPSPLLNSIGSFSVFVCPPLPVLLDSPVSSVLSGAMAHCGAHVLPRMRVATDRGLGVRERLRNVIGACLGSSVRGARLYSKSGLSYSVGSKEVRSVRPSHVSIPRTCLLVSFPCQSRVKEEVCRQSLQPASAAAWALHSTYSSLLSLLLLGR